jgi:hypothetical protein
LGGSDSGGFLIDCAATDHDAKDGPSGTAAGGTRRGSDRSRSRQGVEIAARGKQGHRRERDQRNKFPAYHQGPHTCSTAANTANGTRHDPREKISFSGCVDQEKHICVTIEFQSDELICVQ